MHLAVRAYVLIVATALLAIMGVWSEQPGFQDAWLWPAALLLAGLALEGYMTRRAVIRADVEFPGALFLGREQPAAFAFHSEFGRDIELEYAPAMPVGFEPLHDTRKLTVPARGAGRDPFVLLPVRLGASVWPELPARVCGVLGLAWWPRTLQPSRKVSVAPDTAKVDRVRPRGTASGTRPRRTAGAGSELHQLRAYVRGDPLARVDWKATARTGRLITREFSEDQHLDVLIAIDAGRFSRIRAGRLDRFGLYANIAARFAEVATPNDDRVGLVVYSDRPLAVCVPDRGLHAVMRIRKTLEQLTVQPAESDAVSAAIRINSLLKHRSLVVLLTDLDDAAVADQLARAVRLLSPPHLVVVAGVHSPDIGDLIRREADSWRDPWVALAAQDHENRAAAQRVLLRRLGAPVIAARENVLEEAVLTEYEKLRRARRI